MKDKSKSWAERFDKEWSDWIDKGSDGNCYFHKDNAKAFITKEIQSAEQRGYDFGFEDGSRKQIKVIDDPKAIQKAKQEGAREALEKAKKKVVRWHVISKLKHLDAIVFFLQNPNEVEIKYALPTESQIDHLIKEYKKPLSPKELSDTMGIDDKGRGR